MEFAFVSNTNIFFGKGCVKKNAGKWMLGKRAYVVTGAHSGRQSGALSDIEDVLHGQGIPYAVYEGIGNNPTVEQCREVAGLARGTGADFIVAAGGGSPLDAAKAIAVLAVEDVSTDVLFANQFTRALPVAAIPTTSGTGSEATPWSILTRHDISTKKSFGNPLTLPAAALLDPAYTESLPRAITLQTGLDAFTHCFESFMTRKAQPITDAYNREALRRFGSCMEALESGDLGAIRGELMLVSLLGGMSIAHTGTTMMHGMGYPVTYYLGLAHGEANCATLPGYLRYMGRMDSGRLEEALGALGKSAEQLIAYVRRNFPLTFTVSRGQIRHFASQAILQGSVNNSRCAVTEEDVERIYLDSFQEQLV